METEIKTNALATVLNSVVDIKLSKDDLTAVAVDELEEYLEGELEVATLAFNKAQTAYNDAQSLYNTETTKFVQERYKVQTADSIKLIKKLANGEYKEDGLSINASQGYRGPVNLTVGGFGVSISFTIQDLEFNQEQRTFNTGLYDKIVVPAQEKYNEASRTRQEIQMRIHEIPKMEKKFKAELSRRVLAGTDGGKQVLTLLTNKVASIKNKKKVS